MPHITMIILLLAIFFYTSYISGTDIPQSPTEVIKVKLGNHITLNCSFSKDQMKNNLFWYKQVFGHKPRVIGVVKTYSAVFYNNAFNNTRFRIVKTDHHVQLVIFDTKLSDEGMYFGGVEMSHNIEFGNGTFLSFQENEKSSSTISVVQSLLSDPVYPGHSVTLRCTVLTETRTNDLKIFWISTASGGDLHPGSIYVHKNSSSQCEITSEKSCTNELLKSHVGLDDVGMHYCAVSTCGRIVLGNGTMLQIESSLHHLVVGLGLALVMSLVVILVLVCVIYYRVGFHSSICGQQVKHNNSLSVASGDQAGDSGALMYTTLHFSNTAGKRGRKKKSSPPPQDVVYSSVNLT
ncbi:uncharacterized protein LOC121682369 [Alosa sapidissima]|uniref:uncharacterized protein LOC121682369 n=1 Tax=Alosa sapidissima TaxID=34773 RepID=UPI001C08E721|nr:uncharacterized protein LOC121682369 [Alosa sapidissima]XP_041918421.1 uncharacterized protein LOC121682369 [Alosa sapidissima]